MRIVALAGPGRAALLAAAAREHRVRATADPEGAAHEVREGCDVLLVDASCDGARRLAEDVRGDPDLLGTAVVVLLDDAAGIDGWLPTADDVLVAATAEQEVCARVRSTGRLAALRDELHARTTALEELAYTDPLTGLPNRRYLSGRLDALLSASRRHGHQLTLLVADLDRFKDVNDRHGHAVGDRLLRAAAEGLRRGLRAEDVLGRLGGDEFLAILPETGAAAAEASAERLRATVTEELRRVAGGVPVGISVGVASWDGAETAGALLRRGDAALYAAKRAGRGRLVRA